MNMKEKIDQLAQFLRESRLELKKVSWPTREQTMASTAMVLLVSIVVAIFLGVVDLGLARFVATLIR
ncbi:MAG: preprotein translocase subunit SecE [Candidatus Tectomicrobia bacterium]|uniref:Protein translocase subunit SecE n=1 Tax=Tectimicrobiota bacterium TaxID=2528274 RepID=A0A932GS95_UNCTE|nr:preprotein translocase subunit SecE [Candidatus Tectomicrobia bacterium]